MFQSKEQGKSPEKDLNEMEVSSLPDKEFELMVIKMLTDFRRKMDEHSKNVNKEIENISRYQTEVETELKNTLEGSAKEWMK